MPAGEHPGRRARQVRGMVLDDQSRAAFFTFCVALVVVWAPTYFFAARREHLAGHVVEHDYDDRDLPDGGAPADEFDRGATRPCNTSSTRSPTGSPTSCVTSTPTATAPTCTRMLWGCGDTRGLEGPRARRATRTIDAAVTQRPHTRSLFEADDEPDGLTRRARELRMPNESDELLHDAQAPPRGLTRVGRRTTGTPPPLRSPRRGSRVGCARRSP